MKYNKLQCGIYIIGIIFGMYIYTSCSSTGGLQYPLFKNDLVRYGLLLNTNDTYIEQTTVYPASIYSNDSYRNIANAYVNTTHIEDIIKTSRRSDAQFPNMQEVTRIRMLGYDSFVSNEVISSPFLVEVDQGGAGGPLHYWYVLNYDVKNNTIIELDDLFTTPLDAKTAIMSYLFQDIKRQKVSRNVSSGNIEKELIQRLQGGKKTETFSFIASSRTPSKASGLTFYFDEYTIGRKSEGTYSVNVPITIFLPYTKDSFKGLFLNEIPPIVVADPALIIQSIYPDLL